MGFIKSFGMKKILVVVGVFLFMSVAAFFVLDKMGGSVELAREAKYVAYVAQMRRIIDGANALSAFNKISAPWSCLGIYSDEDKACWEDENERITNNLLANRALASVESIPDGQFSPYKKIHDRGVVFKIGTYGIEMKVYVGDPQRTPVVCRQLNMVQDPEDGLSCILPSPIKKN